MSNIFLDTNGWLAILNTAERLHAQSYQLWLELMTGGLASL
jgi:predicted nucleic acid-binding protein